MSGIDRSGQCLCGAVSFAARGVRRDYGACHCGMCQHWTGTAFVAVSVPEADITWTGESLIRRYQSSSWAERAWCDRCGGHLWYRVTAEGPHKGNYEVPIGLFDDTSGFDLRGEIYVDMAPDSFAIAGEHTRMTAEEARRRFSYEESPS
ncbi:GFA family protein [Chachezhania sediminis]|uniref:GFA family protein n=1 Tax=Chachezhania sediminis TaxID=2599291 RepID=UPI001E43229F|nr:GFA family protein [Chachezhania sediminis]